METLANFRDIGGLPVVGGKHIKKGCFYRSANLDYATYDDLDYLKNLGIKIVYDYRDEDEGNSDAPYIKMGAEHRQIPATFENAKLFKLKNGKNPFEKLFMKVEPEDIAKTYAILPFDNEAYRSMIATAVKGDVPFLQHCTAGKDRAGMGIALLMLLLGAEEDTVMEEYMRSESVKPFVEAIFAPIIPKPFRSFIFKRYEPLFTVYPCLLESALNAIKERYGTYEEYFRSEYGLATTAIAEFRARFTE